MKVRSTLALAVLASTLTFAGAAAADDPPPPAPDAPQPVDPASKDDATKIASPTEADLPPAGPHPGEAKPGDTQRFVGGLIGAAGFLTLAVGTFFTISAMTLYDEADSRCARGACDASDVRDSRLARDRANAGGWVLLGGAALLGGGVALYLTATPKGGARKDPPRPQAGLAPTAGGLAAFGTF